MHRQASTGQSLTMVRGRAGNRNRDLWKGSCQLLTSHAYTETANSEHDARSAAKCCNRNVHAPTRSNAWFVRRCAVSEDRDAVKQRIKEANDIVDVVSGYMALRQAGPTFKGLCPFH